MDQAFTVETDNDRSVIVKRSFNAPAALLWRAYTEPDLIRQWLLGPDGWSMPVCDMDFRVGGTFHWRYRNDESGAEFGFVGEFVEIVEHKLIVNREKPEDAPEMPDSLVRVEFVDDGAQSVLIMTMSYADTKARDDAVATGMTSGMAESFNRLEGLLKAGLV